MSKLERWIACFAIVLALAGAAWACGPDFPNQLLDQRAATLRATPVNGFAFEMARLLRPGDSLKAVEGATGEVPPPIDIGVLDPAQRQIWQRVAALATQVGGDGEQAYAAGAGLPPAIRLYAAAAVDFRHGAACAADGVLAHAGSAAAPAASCAVAAAPLARAAQRFQAVLDLPAEQARPAQVAAAYMLGRIHLRQFADCADCRPDDWQATIAADFGRVRAAALAGAPDPQGLAVASYGEQARLALRGEAGSADADGSFCRWQGFIADGACPATIPAPAYALAMHGYAEQAARASMVGVQSLRHLAGYALRHPPLLPGLLADPLARRVLVDYALAYSLDGPLAQAEAPDSVIGADRLANLVEAIDRLGVGEVDGSDRLAALAYRSGRYAIAERLLQHAQTPLAWWVRAKLALHGGDLAAANQAYARALQAFPQDPAALALDPGQVARLHGEQGVLSLARGEYLAAMAQLWSQADTYWGDIAYLAERVLTLEELRGFVDAQVPATTTASAHGDAEDDQASYRWYDGGVSRPVALRELLARRLMRAGRYEQALPYFAEPVAAAATATPADTSSSEPAPPQHRRWADDYAKALQRADRAWTDIGKAEALYAAARIAREHGMAILGYEAAPDYYAIDGEFQGGLGQDHLKPDPYLGTDEAQRFAASAPALPYRLHYRYQAAALAERSADLLSPRSQAFAAVLCQGARWMLQGPPDYQDQYPNWGEPKPGGTPWRLQRAAALYQRYLKQGPYVAWAKGFGYRCEEPDFVRARSQWRQDQVLRARHWARHYGGYAGGAVLLVVVGSILLRRRRRR